MPANYCTVADTIVNVLGNPIGQAGTVKVAPTTEPLFVDGTLWNLTRSEPAASKVSNSGTWTVNLPYPSISDPSGIQFAITMPDRSKLVGTVPSVAGPLTLHDLKVTYSWTYSAQ